MLIRATLFTQKISDEPNTGRLGEFFRKQEDENFALFSYVNELSYEVETLNESVQQVQDDIGRYNFNCSCTNKCISFALEN